MKQTQSDGQVLVIQQCDETRIFANEHGTISILQIDQFGESALITFPTQYVEDVCRAIRTASKHLAECGNG